MHTILTIPCGKRSPVLLCVATRNLPLAHRKSYSTNASSIDPIPKKLEKETTILPARPGLVPFHSSYLVLHTSSHPATWPSHPPMVSSLIRDLTLRTKQLQGLVNVSYDPELSRRGLHFPLGGSNTIPESYPATLYRENQPPLSFSSLSFTSSPDISTYISPFSTTKETYPLPNSSVSTTRSRHLYVCTHGSRDCRCGDIGGALHTVLRQRISEAQSSSANVVLREIAHVGGHKYAGNVLDLLTGDWYGSISAEEASVFFDALTASDAPLGVKSEDRTEHGERLLWSKWRGRMGLLPQEQEAYFEAHSPKAETSSSSLVTSKEKPALVQLIFETSEGVKLSVTADEGQNLMEVAKKGELPGIEGVCGGQLECATCHMYIASPASSNLSLPPLPPVSETEEDMLEYALFRSDSSRLGCQIRVTQELGEWCSQGGAIKLPRY